MGGMLEILAVSEEGRHEHLGDGSERSRSTITAQKSTLAKNSIALPRLEVTQTLPVKSSDFLILATVLLLLETSSRFIARTPKIYCILLSEVIHRNINESNYSYINNNI